MIWVSCGLIQGKSWIRVISVALLVAPLLVAVWAFGIEPRLLEIRHLRMRPGEAFGVFDVGRVGRELHRFERAGEIPLELARVGDARIRGGAGLEPHHAVERVERLVVFAELEVASDGGGLFPVSARTGTGVEALVEHLLSLMPEGPFMFAAGASTDQPRELLLAELIREAVIRRTFQELPHAVEVVVEELEYPREGLARVRALVWVETDSQKGILIGAHGRMIKAIGTAARRELQRALGVQVHLELSVRVRRDWRADADLLDRLGIT